MVVKGGARSGNQQDPPYLLQGMQLDPPPPILGNLHTIPLVSALAQGVSVLHQVWKSPQ